MGRGLALEEDLGGNGSPPSSDTPHPVGEPLPRHQEGTSTSISPNALALGRLGVLAASSRSAAERFLESLGVEAELVLTGT